MDMCNGGNFETYLNQIRGGKMPEVEARAIFK